MKLPFSQIVQDSGRRQPDQKPIRLRFYLVAIVIVIAAIAAVPYAFGPPSSPAIRVHLYEMWVTGYPGTIEELEAWYGAVAPEEDAVPLLRGAMQEIKPFSRLDVRDSWFSVYDLPKLDEELSEELWNRISSNLEANADLMGKLREGRPFRGKRYPHFGIFGMSEIGLSEWEVLGYPIGMVTSAVDSLCQLMAVDALIRVESGDGDGAVRSLICFIDLTETLRLEPSVGLQLRRSLLYNYVSRLLPRILSYTEPSPSVLRELQAALAEADDSEGLLRALIAQRCVGISRFEASLWWFGIFRGADGESKKYYSPFSEPLRLRWSEGKTKDMETFLDYWDREIAILELPESERLAVDLQFIQDSRRLILKEQEKLIVCFSECAQSRGYSQLYKSHAAQLRVAIVALDVELFHQAHGRFPDTLAEIGSQLGPGVFIDPYQGEEVHYELTGSGYSVNAGPGRERAGRKSWLSGIVVQKKVLNAL